MPVPGARAVPPPPAPTRDRSPGRAAASDDHDDVREPRPGRVAALLDHQARPFLAGDLAVLHPHVRVAGSHDARHRRCRRRTDRGSIIRGPDRPGRLRRNDRRLGLDRPHVGRTFPDRGPPTYAHTSRHTSTIAHSFDKVAAPATPRPQPPRRQRGPLSGSRNATTAMRPSPHTSRRRRLTCPNASWRPTRPRR